MDADATLNSLLAEVVANPGDDFPRDVLADYMDDRGRPDVAGLLRLREPVEGFPLAHALSLCRYDRLSSPFLCDYTPLEVLRPFRCVVRRGFVEQVTLTADAWHDFGRMLVRTQPIRTVRLTDWWPMGGHWCTALDQGDLPPSEMATEFGYAYRPFFEHTGTPFLAFWRQTVHPTVEDAEAALSARCLEWARRCEPVRVPAAIPGAQ